MSDIYNADRYINPIIPSKSSVIYKNYSNDCIFFKYVFDADDISSENSKKPADDTDTFKPEYTHQIFGDEEVINFLI